MILLASSMQMLRINFSASYVRLPGGETAILSHKWRMLDGAAERMMLIPTINQILAVYPLAGWLHVMGSEQLHSVSMATWKQRSACDLSQG